ncbi:MAG: hypothetical protein H6719_18645 [Sandaracinaceae bacterium]|nr:hypothetical protein [Sandaracinaceae bacterium]
MRPVGPGGRGRTLAVSLDVLRDASGHLRPGAAAWLEDAAERFRVAIVGSADARDGEDVATRAWLRASGVSEHVLGRVRFPAHKPPADVYLDPRALRFEGRFPDVAGLSVILPHRQ